MMHERCENIVSRNQFINFIYIENEIDTFFSDKLTLTANQLHFNSIFVSQLSVFIYEMQFCLIFRSRQTNQRKIRGKIPVELKVAKENKKIISGKLCHSIFQLFDCTQWFYWLAARCTYFPTINSIRSRTLFEYRKNNDQRQILHTKAVLRFIWKILLLLSILLLVGFLLSFRFHIYTRHNRNGIVRRTLCPHMFSICINIVFVDDQITWIK